MASTMSDIAAIAMDDAQLASMCEEVLHWINGFLLEDDMIYPTPEMRERAYDATAGPLTEKPINERILP
jgi:hypothetical protein